MYKFEIIKFAKNSYPIFEGDMPNDYFYILKSGKALRTYKNPVINKKDQEEIKPGDFFGFISVMAERPHIYSIQIIEDSQVILVRKNNLLELLKNNESLAYKIMRNFSYKIRVNNEFIMRLTKKSSVNDEKEKLFEIGEYFLSNGQLKNALRAYEAYLTKHPDGLKIKEAKEKINKVKAKASVETLKFDKNVEEKFTMLKAGDVLFFESEEGDYMYVIQSGEIKVVRIAGNTEVLLNILKAGDVLGEMAFLENKERNATAIANKDTILLKVSMKNIPAFINQYPQFAIKLISTLSDRIWFLQMHACNLMISDVPTRLYDALYIHAIKERVDISNYTVWNTGLRMEEILNFTALNNSEGRESFKKILEQKQYFDLNKNIIICKNTKFLKEMAYSIKRKF